MSVILLPWSCHEPFSIRNEFRPYALLALSTEANLPIDNSRFVPAIVDTGFPGDVCLLIEHLCHFLPTFNSEGLPISCVIPNETTYISDSRRGDFLLSDMSFSVLNGATPTNSLSVRTSKYIKMKVKIMINKEYKTIIEQQLHNKYSKFITLPSGMAKRPDDSDARPQLPLVGVRGLMKAKLMLELENNQFRISRFTANAKLKA